MLWHSIDRMIVDLVMRLSRWVCWVVSDEQPGIGADGFQEIFTATMMASLEWGCYDYARGVLDNWLTYFIKDKGFVLYRGLEMAQHGRMLTNIAQCTRPGLPSSQALSLLSWPEILCYSRSG